MAEQEILEKANGEREANYVRLARRLRSRMKAGELKEGKLPSFRSLAGEFGVSIGVVQRAMELLRQESLVKIQHGKAARAVPGGRILPEIAKYGVIHPYTQGNDFERYLIALCAEEFDRKCNHAVSIVRSSNGDARRERELAETLVYNGVSGLLLSPENGSVNAEYFSELARRTPIMLIDQPLAGTELPLVMFDYAGAGCEIASKLRQAGRTKTLLLLNETTNSSIEALIAGMNGIVETVPFRAPLFRMAVQEKARNYELLDTIAAKLRDRLEDISIDSIFSPYDVQLDHLVMMELPPEIRARLQCVVICGDLQEWHSRSYCENGVWEWKAGQSALIGRAFERLLRWRFGHRMPRGIHKIKLREIN